jgi:peptidoglycan hydrolase-like protein with peptidoglycan-binding domain
MIRDLAWGSSGEDVRRMQGMLNLHLAAKTSPPLKTDGLFGPKTDARVRYFQQINRLSVDGIVGPITRRAILDFRRTTSGAAGAPPGVSSAALPTPTRFVLRPPLRSASFAGRVPVFGQVVRQAAPGDPTKKTLSVVVQQGTAVNVAPNFLSPLVLTAQANYFIRNDGRKPFVISPSLQLSANQVGSPVGPWTGQAAVQFGPQEITDGPIDWFNPFVQLALQKNANQPFNLGLSIGDQVNWNLIDNKLSLFVNGQVTTSVDLSTGTCSAPAAQILGGVSFEFVLF